MRLVIIILLVVGFVGCGTERKETSYSDCSRFIDKGVAKLQQFAFSLDTLKLDSALTYYDEAIQCDTLDVKKLELGRYRESLTIIDNVYKVREVPASRDIRFFIIKGWLFERLGDKDSSLLYYQRAKSQKGF